MEKVRQGELKVSKSRNLKITFSPKTNGRGFQSKHHTAFTAGEWNLTTLKFLKSVNKLSSDEMQVIMDLSRSLLKESDSHELDDDDDDPRGNLQQRTFNESEIESCSDDENMPGWDLAEKPQKLAAAGPSSSKGKSGA